MHSAHLISPAGTMQATKRLYAHHCGRPPAQYSTQTWQRTLCHNVKCMDQEESEQCQYRFGLQQWIPTGMWRCSCGTDKSYYVRFCRQCATFVGNTGQCQKPPVSTARSQSYLETQVGTILGNIPTLPITTTTRSKLGTGATSTKHVETN